MYAQAVLADRQGLFQGDLDMVQRALLSYLIGREVENEEDREVRELKSRLFVAHPEWDVDKMFDEQEDLAIQLTDEEMDNAGPLSANEIEAAVQIMRDLGFAVQDI